MVTFNVSSLDFVDDEEARFGADTDFATRFSSANTRLELEDLTNATVGYVPQGTDTDLISGKFGEAVSDGKVLSDDGNVYDTIQDALDSASSWVKLGTGTFTENVNVRTANMTIVGSGDNTVVEASSGSAFEINATNVTIRDLGIAADEDGITTANQNATDFTAYNLDIEFGVRAIETEKGSDGARVDGWSVINCEMYGGTWGVYIGGGGIVSGNLIYEVYDGVVAAQDGNDDSNHVVVNNTIKDCQQNGIENRSYDSLYGGNVIRNCEVGINVLAGADNIVFNNNISAYRDTGINDSGTNTTLDANITTQQV